MVNQEKLDETRLTSSQFFELILTNDYGKKYLEIVGNAKKSKPNLKGGSYCEIHHILPKCYGGGDDSSNKVKLTCKDHLLVHIYLALSTKNVFMYMAVNLMFNRIFNSLSDIEKYAFEKVDEFAEVRRKAQTRLFSEEGRKKISEKAKDRWKRFRESGRIDEVKNNISKTTKEGMKKSKHSQIRTRINLNSKWYYNETEDKEMHWYEGMEEPDPTLWRRGRRGNSKESREKLKKTLNARRKIFYHNDELKINTTFNEGDVIPPGWEIGSKPEYRGNNSKFSKIEKENKLNELKH